MPRYYFHLEGPMTAHDKVGHECRDDQAAKNDGEFIAHRLATEQPDLVPEGSTSWSRMPVMNGSRNKRSPLTSSTGQPCRRIAGRVSFATHKTWSTLEFDSRHGPAAIVTLDRDLEPMQIVQMDLFDSSSDAAR